MEVKSIAECSEGTSIKLSFSIKTLVLSIFKWPFKAGFTVFYSTSYGKGTADTMEQTEGASGTTDLEKESQGNNYKAASLRCVLEQEHLS